MRGKTLEALVDDLRAETRLSLNPAHNAQDRDVQVKHLQRVQEWLWDDYDWPHLRVERLIPLQAGQRYYAFPSDLSMDRVEQFSVQAEGRRAAKLVAGIGDDEYDVTSSDAGERAWPPRRWRYTESQDFEVWPVPDRTYDATTGDGLLKITGIRTLAPLVDSSDRADLDDRLIVLFAAAERLAASGAKDANFKRDTALKRYAKLKSETQNVRRFRMLASQDDDCRRDRRFAAVGGADYTRVGSVTSGTGPSYGSGGAASGLVGSPDDIVVRVDGGRRD